MSEIIKETETTEEVKPLNMPTEERSVVFEEALEAILFAAGHPISYATLARVFELTPAKVKENVKAEIADFIEKIVSTSGDAFNADRAGGTE